MTIIEISQNTCEVKELKPSCEAIYQDMQTCAPTSALDQRKLLEDEETASGRGASSDSDTSESEGDDEGPRYQEDEYYAFLREMAGSFEATSEDESDEGSGDEVEDEVVQPSCRKRSSSFWIGDQHDGHSSPLTSSNRKGCDEGIGLNKGDKREYQCKDHELETQKSNITSHEHHKAALSEVGCSRKEIMRSGSDSTGCSTSWGSFRSPSEGNLSELSDCEDGRDAVDAHCPLVPTPLHDTRGPVEDDYDVIQALQEFAAFRKGDAASQQREDLLSTMSLKQMQASQLLVSITNRCTQPKIREHYQHVREQLLEEARRIQESLDMLL
jgi:hypothetical protein